MKTDLEKHIETAKIIVQSIDYKICNLDEESKKALSFFIQLGERVSGGVKKVENIAIGGADSFKCLIPLSSNRILQGNELDAEIFNSAIDFCNAHLASKLSMIWDIIVKGLEGRSLVGEKQKEEAADDISQAITNLFTERKE